MKGRKAESRWLGDILGGIALAALMLGTLLMFLGA